MNIAIISSTKDKASVNIKENLINNFGFNKIKEEFDNNNIFQYNFDNKIIKLHTLDSDLIDAENIDNRVSADLFVFISRHSAKEERKCLTAHAPGNFGKNEMGGKEKTLCVAPAFCLKKIIRELNKNAENSDYEVSMEVTHHGPFLEKPVLFVEIGSAEKEWLDSNAGNIIAKSLISTIKNNSMVNNNLINKNYNGSIDKNSNGKNKSKITINHGNSMETKNNEKSSNEITNNNYESVFVIGGSHYNHVANKVMLKTDFAVGHICAKYNLENSDIELIKQAMEKTVPKAKFVLLDWKGLGKEKQRILEMLERNGIEYKRSDKI